MLRRCLLYGFDDYYGRELEVRMATYGPGIDQSQHAKSVSHIIIYFINFVPELYLFLYFLCTVLFILLIFTFFVLISNSLLLILCTFCT